MCLKQAVAKINRKCSYCDDDIAIDETFYIQSANSPQEVEVEIADLCFCCKEREFKGVDDDETKSNIKENKIKRLVEKTFQNIVEQIEVVRELTVICETDVEDDRYELVHDIKNRLYGAKKRLRVILREIKK